MNENYRFGLEKDFKMFDVSGCDRDLEISSFASNK